MGKNGKVVKIYTSIGSGMNITRSKGTDAVRIFLFDEKKQKPLSQSKRIYRTKGAINRIVEKIRNLLLKVEDDPEKQEEKTPAVIQIPVNESEWISTESFPYCEFKYESFNPVQSAFFKVYRELPANCVVAATTSAGKTVIAEMAISYTLEFLKRPALYLAPLKALSQEKIDDWNFFRHSFFQYKKVIATGDYVTPENRKKILAECANADLIVMTTELMDSLSRMNRHIEVFRRLGIVVVDESHLITVPKRGSALECALVKLTEHFKTPVLFLSATMPNTQELAQWLSDLNGLKTFVISSEWRPCKLTVHYIGYGDYGGYHGKTENLIEEIINLISTHSEDKFLVFVHSKSFGRKLLRRFIDIGIKAEFHNADLDREDRLRLVEEFKRKNGLRVLIATSTLAWGINVPARRVIVAGIHRASEEVSPVDIKQMVGRAGRVGLDPEGDAYILIPQSRWNLYYGYADFIPPIVSRFLFDKKELAFHIIARITEGVNTLEGLKTWYKRTLAYRQNPPGIISTTPDRILDDAVRYLEQYEAIKITPDGKITSTHIGLIASYLYYPPEFIFKLRNNLLEVNGMSEAGDREMAWALGSSFEPMFCSKEVQTAVEHYLDESGISRLFTFVYGTEVYIATIHMFLKGYSIPMLLGSVARLIQSDSERLVAAMEMVSQRYGFRNILSCISALGLRLKYGVPEEMLNLVKIEGIGPARAKKLFESGLKNSDDILNHQDKVRQIFTPKVADLIIRNALRTLQNRKKQQEEIFTG